MASSSSSTGSKSGQAAGPVRCAVCGGESRQPPFRPNPPEQPPDLDLRPGEPLRSTMARWLQQCPHCAYAAPDIARAHPAAAETVAAGPFRALVAETSYPPLARRFLAWAHVLEETGALHAAAEATLHAAWVADDLDRPDLATEWRLDAVALWRGGPHLDAEQTIRIIDALRRAQAWEDAAITVESLTATQPSSHVAQVLTLESRLVAAKDSGRHTLASALPPTFPRPHVAQQQLGRPTSKAGQGGGLLGWFRKLFRRG